MSMSGWDEVTSSSLTLSSFWEINFTGVLKIGGEWRRLGPGATKRNSDIPPVLHGYSIPSELPTEMSAGRRSGDQGLN